LLLLQRSPVSSRLRVGLSLFAAAPYARAHAPSEEVEERLNVEGTDERRW
jgi:hypothetical protein